MNPELRPGKEHFWARLTTKRLNSGMDLFVRPYGRWIFESFAADFAAEFFFVAKLEMLRPNVSG